MLCTDRSGTKMRTRRRSRWLPKHILKKTFLKKQQQTVPKIDLYGRWCECAVERSEELSVFVSLLGYGEIELELVENLLLMLAFSDEGAVKLRTRSQSLGFCGVEEGAHLFFRWKAFPGV